MKQVDVLIIGGGPAWALLRRLPRTTRAAGTS